MKTFCKFVLNQKQKYMLKKYYVTEDQLNINSYSVMEEITIQGKRINAYESENDITKTKKVYAGSPSDCLAFIELNDKNYLDV